MSGREMLGREMSSRETLVNPFVECYISSC